MSDIFVSLCVAIVEQSLSKGEVERGFPRMAQGEASQPQTACIDSLPDEILVEMVGILPKDTLLDVALCSQRLHRLATSFLYRCVRDEDWKEEELSSQQSTLCEWLTTLRPSETSIPQVFKIHSLTDFLRTITASETLRAQVVVAGFDCYLNFAGRLLPFVLRLIMPTLRALFKSLFKK